jgi:hypothetical protein
MKSIAFLLALVLGTSFSQVMAAENGTPILGFQCYTVAEQRLHLTPDDYFSGSKFPEVLDAPHVGAKAVSRVAAIFYVTWPLKIENDFVQVLYHTNQLGWVPQSAIRLLRKADGEPGGCKLWWGPDGRIMFALDPGVSIRN